MNTREIAKEYRLSHWAQVVRERAESGLSIKAYCKRAGCHEAVYYYWQRKLREAACEQRAVPSFTEIRMMEKPEQIVLPKTEESGEVRIKASGLEIIVDSEYPTEKLAALLRELTRAC